MSWKEQSVVHVMMFLSFLMSGLLINLVQALLYLTLVKILDLRTVFRRMNYYMVYAIYGQLLFLSDWWSRSKVVYHAAPELMSDLGKGHAIILMNHHYELDWLYGWMVGDRAGVLGNCRVYVKKMIKNVPIIGWAWAFSDTIFLERCWEKDKEHLADKLKVLQDYPSPVWILLFPEGTRFNEDKYLASRQFAEARGLPILKRCLVPRTKGFTFTVAHADPAKVRWVYDVTLGCDPSTAPTLTNVLLGRSTTAHMHMRRFRLEDIPREEEGAAQWLQDRFVEKDQMLDHFHLTGSFPETPDLPSHPGVELPARPCTLVLMIATNCLMLGPIMVYCLLWGGWVTVLVLGMVILLAMVGIKYFISITQISHSSSYGKKDK